jgi:transcription initiation factor TFIID subunit 5
VLYPLFVHCYLDLVARGYPEDARQFLLKHRASFDAHESEIIRLSGITLPEHLRENELALYVAAPVVPELLARVAKRYAKNVFREDDIRW